MKWEYKLVILDLWEYGPIEMGDYYIKRNVELMSKFHEAMNRYGAEGWEAVSLTPRSGDQRVVAYVFFKRLTSN